jgi:tetratricopeptide (TPR) repeat protein
MKKFCLLILILSMLAWLAAEANPVTDYFSNPTSAAYIAAVQYCSTSLEKDPSQNMLKIQLASLAVTEANRLTADVSSAEDKLDTAGLFQYGNLLLAQKRYQDAINVYQKINVSTPAWSCPWRHKGEAYFRLNNYKQALEALLMAVETNRQHYDAYLWLARTQYQLKKYKAGLQSLETALTLNPKAEENQDEVMSENSIKALHDALLKKTGKRN